MWIIEFPKGRSAVKTVGVDLGCSAVGAVTGTLSAYSLLAGMSQSTLTVDIQNITSSATISISGTSINVG
ncbi:hypothetical protein E3E36_08065 [Thermococcus sp. M36]|uniref:hypothetical protein n=1 Tax=Thermococcus sp. M36 TaxID=1638261 RepID=UPI0014389652|nr:hypothetical protein [Thermococcus sp. M36]NJE06093.1 hypothetical protein [Thermococcus sp. M36]